VDSSISNSIFSTPFEECVIDAKVNSPLPKRKMVPEEEKLAAQARNVPKNSQQKQKDTP